MAETVPNDPTDDAVIAATQRWLERAVIGLNLCPFAKAVHVKRGIRYVVSRARDTEALAATLERELTLLANRPIDEVETTLIVHPDVLRDFLDYNDFLDEADSVVEALALDGVLQVASFHPDYQFADASADDVTNCTNRSPYPMLHLLREASVARAVAAFPDAEAIYERNIETMRKLGVSGWRALFDADEVGGG